MREQITLNEKEQKRAMVLTTVTDGRVTVRQAGEVLGLSARRLTTRYGTVEKMRVPRLAAG